MDKTEQDRNERIVGAIEKYADMVRRICYVHLKNSSDVEDIFQDVFLQLIRYEMRFDSDAHEKAWLIRVTINKCKDLHKSFFRSRVCPLDDTELTFEDETENEVMQEILRFRKNLRMLYISIITRVIQSLSYPKYYR